MAKTRNSKKCAISEFLGSGGKEFAPAELPTLRDVLLKGVLLKERKEKEDKHHYQIKQSAKDIIPSILSQWSKGNALFSAPVIIEEFSIERRIERAWTHARDIGLKKIKKKDAIESFKLKLDKLFDICKCVCQIKLCDVSGCSGCDVGAHVDCKCKRECKIPVLELAFIKAQRDKIGTYSVMQMGGGDKKETDRQNKALKRKQLEEERRAKKDKIPQDEYQVRYI